MGGIFTRPTGCRHIKTQANKTKQQQALAHACLSIYKLWNYGEIHRSSDFPLTFSLFSKMYFANLEHEHPQSTFNFQFRRQKESSITKHQVVE